MKPADRDRDPGRAELRGQIHRPRELVRLHPDEADQAGIGRLDAPNDVADRDDRVALVISPQFERYIRAERISGRDVLAMP